MGRRDLLFDRWLAQEDAVANFLSSFENNRYRFQVDGFYLILFGMALEQGRRRLPEKQQSRAENLPEFTRHRREYWDSVASSLDRAPRIRAYYRRRLIEIYRFLIPPGMRVLELGCGEGDLLAAVRPAQGAGIDLSPMMIERAWRRHPECQFLEGDAHALDLREQFDFVICSDLLNDVWDVQRVLEQISRLSHPSTRLIINTYSRVWELPRRIAESLGIAAAELAHHRRRHQSFISRRFRSGAVFGGNHVADPHSASGYPV